MIDSNIIAYNQADGSGGGLTVWFSPPLDNHVVKPEFTKTLILPTMTWEPYCVLLMNLASGVPLQKTLPNPSTITSGGRWGIGGNVPGIG